MENDYRIRFGTVGWQHPQWQQEYYPEELPEEWWLPYYGNEFPVVAVPSDSWSDTPSAQVDDWLENSDEHFRFLFEWRWKDAEDLQAFCQRLVSLRDRTLGVLLQIPWAAFQQPAELAAQLAEIAGQPPLCLEIIEEDHHVPLLSFDVEDAGLKQVLAAARANCCWHGSEPVADIFFAAPSLSVTKIIDTAITPVQLRQVLETCSAQIQSHDAMVMVFDGDPPSLSKVQEAMVMLELLS